MNQKELQDRRRRLRLLLRKIRRERGLTQSELAGLLAVPQSVVSKFETGERRLEFVEVEAICDAMGLDLRSFSRRWLSDVEELEG